MYAEAAEKLQIEPELIEAVARQESSRKSFIDGRPVILFEPTWFRRRLQTNGHTIEEVLKDFPEADKVIAFRAPKKYGSHRKQWNNYQTAKQIHRDSSIECCSWGRFQIMGFHWQDLGFESPKAFRDAQDTDEGQFETFSRFMGANPQITDALRKRDWNEFKRLYNGPGPNSYAAELAQQYRRVLADKAPNKPLLPYRRGEQLQRPTDPKKAGGSRTVNAQIADIFQKTAAGGTLVAGGTYTYDDVSSIVDKIKTGSAAIKTAKERVLASADDVEQVAKRVEELQDTLAQMQSFLWFAGIAAIILFWPNIRSIITYMQDNGYFIKRRNR